MHTISSLLKTNHLIDCGRLQVALNLLNNHSMLLSWFISTSINSSESAVSIIN